MIKDNSILKSKGINLKTNTEVIKYCINIVYNQLNGENQNSDYDSESTEKAILQKLNMAAADISKLLILNSKSFESLGVENFKTMNSKTRIQQLSEEIFSADIHSKVTTRNSNSLSTNKINNSESPERRRGLFAD